MSLSFPESVKIVEVGPRDGLQNESQSITTSDKLVFIEKLAQSGLTQIEVTSFVNPKRIPQLADAMEVIQGLKSHEGLTYSALVPNMKGLERAIESGVKRIAVFTAASETFTKKNINMSIQESLEAFRPVVQTALSNGISVRGYVSTCFVCPYEGDIQKDKVLSVTQELCDMGIDEISLGDTIGAAAPTDVFETIGFVLHKIPKNMIALHFHDTYGTALSNVLAGLELGITTFDSSAGGLGGCPYAQGASGNLATEELIYMLHRMGIKTGANMDKLSEASMFMQDVLGRSLPSRHLQRITACKTLEKKLS